jgi:hypothetical protein
MASGGSDGHASANYGEDRDHFKLMFTGENQDFTNFDTSPGKSTSIIARTTLHKRIARVHGTGYVTHLCAHHSGSTPPTYMRTLDSITAHIKCRRAPITCTSTP